MALENAWQRPKARDTTLTSATGIFSFDCVQRCFRHLFCNSPPEARTPQPSLLSLSPQLSPARRGSWKLLQAGRQPRYYPDHFGNVGDAKKGEGEGCVGQKQEGKERGFGGK